jgi:hypothetical protein
VRPSGTLERTSRSSVWRAAWIGPGSRQAGPRTGCGVVRRPAR